jgi:hypothetical protein
MQATAALMTDWFPLHRRFRRNDAVTVKFGLGKYPVGIAVSTTEIEATSSLPKLLRICLAEARSCLPSWVKSFMEASGKDAARRSVRPVVEVGAGPFYRLQELRRPDPAVIIVSMSARVLESNSNPLVGQLRATHSFWLSCSSA